MCFFSLFLFISCGWLLNDLHLQDVFPVVPGDTDFRIFSEDYGDIPGLDIIFILGGYFYHTSFDTVARLLYALHLLFWYRITYFKFSNRFVPKHFLWYIPMPPDLEVYKLVEKICLAYLKPSPILLSYKIPSKDNLMIQLPSSTRVDVLFFLII